MLLMRERIAKHVRMRRVQLSCSADSRGLLVLVCVAQHGIFLRIRCLHSMELVDALGSPFVPLLVSIRLGRVSSRVLLSDVDILQVGWCRYGGYVLD